MKNQFNLQLFATINVDGEFENNYDGVYIVASDGDDEITNYGYDVTIAGGLGDDNIYFNSDSGNFFIYNYGDGDDMLENFSGSVIINDDYVTHIGLNGYGLTAYMGSGGSITFVESMSIYAYYDEYAEDPAFSFEENLLSVGGMDTEGEVVIEAEDVAGYAYVYNGGYMTISGFTSEDTLDLNYIETVSGEDEIGSFYYFGEDGSVEIFTDYGSIYLTEYLYNYGDEETGGVSINLVYNGSLIETILPSVADIDYQYIEGNSYADNFSYPGYHEGVTIDALGGNDTIVGRFWNSSLSGGEGNDVIDISEGDVDYATINPGTGNDTVYMDNYDGYNIYQYYTGDGNDVIYYAKRYDTISIDDGEGSYSTMWSGSDFVIKVGSGAMTLKSVNASLLPAIEGYYEEEEDTVPASGVTLTNFTSNTVINSTAYADSIRNSGDSVNIYAGDGDDIISVNASYNSIYGNAGNDIISVSADYTRINAGAGNDTIYRTNKYGWGYNYFQYANGDGNDVIYGFEAAQDFVSLSSGSSYSTTTSGNDFIVSVGSGKVTLKDSKNAQIRVLNGSISTAWGANTSTRTLSGTANNDYYP